MIMPPTSQISQYHKVTKIMSTTSLSPKMYHRSWDVRTVRWSLPWLRVLNKFSPYMAHKIYEFVVQYFKILNGFWINFPIVWKILPNFGKRIQTLPLQTDENHSNGHYSSQFCCGYVEFIFYFPKCHKSFIKSSADRSRGPGRTIRIGFLAKRSAEPWLDWRQERS